MYFPSYKFALIWNNFGIVLFIPTGWHEQGRTAFSSPASANANTCSPPTGILVLHRKLAQGITGYNHNNIVPLPLRSPSPIPHKGEGWPRNAGIIEYYFLPCIWYFQELIMKVRGWSRDLWWYPTVLIIKLQSVVMRASLIKLPSQPVMMLQA